MNFQFNLFKNTVLKVVTVGFLLLGLSTAVYATKPHPGVSLTDPWTWRLIPETRVLDVENSFPGECLLDTFLSSSAWAGKSKFNITNFRQSDDPESHPDIKVKMADLNLPDIMTATQVGSAGPGFTVLEGHTVFHVPDATVKVSIDLMAAGKFACLDFDFNTFEFVRNVGPNQINYGNAFIHEIGHVAGLAHINPQPCFMYFAAGNGEADKNFCQEEKDAILALHPF